MTPPHHRALASLGLLRPAFRAREWLRSAMSEPPPAKAEDGFALPGRIEMVRVGGHADWRVFLDGGRREANMFAALADEAGVPFAQARAILDWGCGCGRLARHMPAITSARIIGRDIDALNIAWARANLPGDYATCGLTPPFDLEDGAVDAAYALSVLTHLFAETQKLWLAELARVIRPGGLALLTFHDERHPALSNKPSVRDELNRTGFASTTLALEGTNYAATFQTLAFLVELARPWFSLSLSRPSSPSSQAVAVLGRIST